MKKKILTVFFIPFLMLALPSVAKQTEPLTDAEVAAAVLTANKVDVEAGQFALKHSDNKDVKDFAQLMVTDHQATIKLAEKLAQKLKLEPSFNDFSRTLEEGGEENLSKLGKLSGSEFNKAYIEHEVAFHKAVVDAIDNVLLPNAKNEELSSLIKKVRPVIEEHLKHAEMLAKKLK